MVHRGSSTRYVQTGLGELKEVDDKVAVYVREDRAIHVLNPSALMIYQGLDEPASFDELLAALGPVVGAGSEELAEDLDRTLDVFLEHKLIRTAE